MERGILLLFIAAGMVMGLAIALPGIRSAVGIATGAGGFSLLTDATVVTTPGASLTARYESAWVITDQLGSGARTLLVLGAAAGALTTFFTVGSVMLFFFLLLWRRPFHRALVVATRVAGASLLIGGILSAGLGGLGRMRAADELNPAAGNVFVIGSSFDPAWALAGLSILALSVVFSYGIRLQRDTEGLV
jgi:hypothetical protein